MTTETNLSLDQVSHRIEAALGVTFGPTTIIRTPPKGGYARMAQALDHEIQLYAETGPFSSALPRSVAVNLWPTTNLAALGLDLTSCKVIELDIADYLVAILNNETGLLFRKDSAKTRGY